MRHRGGRGLVADPAQQNLPGNGELLACEGERAAPRLPAGHAPPARWMLPALLQL